VLIKLYQLADEFMLLTTFLLRQIYEYLNLILLEFIIHLLNSH